MAPRMQSGSSHPISAAWTIPAVICNGIVHEPTNKVAMRIILSHGPSVLCGIQARCNSIVGLKQLIGNKTEEVESDGPDRLLALQNL